eukprot:CAMPEP_0171220768 /NCGR_PEP_ID=MMETSP0790-20130122/34412_1 /TAXON_ID=2925 /ORGANISM="Alexandrium catenella, Strain OF101" /LENGTH=70 /DNA_ID=CAMNT_0011686681 /DNA_START=51 /DNA_END=259 /DNA_ORIENTATION=-
MQGKRSPVSRVAPLHAWQPDGEAAVLQQAARGTSGGSARAELSPLADGPPSQDRPVCPRNLPEAQLTSSR